MDYFVHLPKGLDIYNRYVYFIICHKMTEKGGFKYVQKFNTEEITYELRLDYSHLRRVERKSNRGLTGKTRYCSIAYSF